MYRSEPYSILCSPPKKVRTLDKATPIVYNGAESPAKGEIVVDPIEKQKETFEQNKPKRYISEHYIFHFSQGSLAEKEILSIAEEQEACFAEICCTLQVEYPEKIHYYLTDSPIEIGEILWGKGQSCNGLAWCGENKIYAVYNETTKCMGFHEDTHLISATIGFPDGDFWMEGLAMAFDSVWWDIPNEVWAAYYMETNPNLSVAALTDNQIFASYDCGITYPIAGAFTRFLINTYGIQTYLEFFRSNGADFAATFHTSLPDAEAAFRTTLCTVPADAVTLENLRKENG